MAIKFFGQFLVEKGAVSTEEILDAVEIQKISNLKFGEMALAMGLLSESDVDKVHDIQHRTEQSFDHLAVHLGLLTEEQKAQVAEMQHERHLDIGRALVESGAISAEELETWQARFQQSDQTLYLAETVDVPYDILCPDVWEAFADLTYKMLNALANLPHGKEPCRVFDRLEKNHAVATMELTGVVRARYLYSPPRPMCRPPSPEP